MSDSDSDSEITAIVIKNGSGTIKAGFAGDDAPTLTEPSKSKPQGINLMAAARYNGQCYDPSQIRPRSSKRDQYLKDYPIRRGIVENWDKMEAVWQNTFTRVNVDASERAVLLTETSLNQKANREKSTQIMFETFEVPQFYVSIDSTLALYAAGRTTGTVITSGFGVTNVTPVYEAYILPHAVHRLDIAGMDITEHIMRCHSRSFEWAKHIKETLCGLEESEEDTSESVQYKLPDGEIVKLGEERFRAAELLFCPLIKLAIKSINECDVDIRKELYGNIVMCGGSTLFDGMQERFTKEICQIAPESTKIKVIAPPERMNSAWIGGSIVSSLSTFEEMWIEKEEYYDSGPSIVHRKCC